MRISLICAINCTVPIGPCKFFADCGPSHVDRPDEAVMAGLAPSLDPPVSAQTSGETDALTICQNASSVYRSGVHNSRRSPTSGLHGVSGRVVNRTAQISPWVIASSDKPSGPETVTVVIQLLLFTVA